MVRFSIPVPGADGPIALSPDGRKLAYTGRGPKGETLLWIHSFDSAEDRALDGANDAAFPFWSPDSRNIGFFAHGKLKRIESSGGPPLDLCDAPQGRGATWNINGEIIFAPAAFGPLSRVSAAGGIPQQLGSSDASRSSKTQRWPHTLPDGRHFLYWASIPPPQGDGVFVGMVGSSEARALLPGASAAVFSNGYLLFVRRHVLLTQPFDALRLELTGEARPITEGAGWSADRGPAFSVSTNGLLAYRTSADPRTRLLWVDRQGKIVGQVGEPGLVDAFSLSPDGMRAVIARRESEDGNSALWVLDFAREVNMRLTFGPLSNSSPIWSPDGSRILFSSRRDAGSGVYQVSANGSGQEELLFQTPGTVTLDSRSADGRFVAYTASDTKGGSAIWALPLQGGERKPMPILQNSFRVRQAMFSPDGRWIAYVSNESGRDEVYVSSFPAGQGKWLISSSGGIRPSWRPDGRELFYLSPDGMLMAAEVISSTSGIRPATSRPLFQTNESTAYAASADGRRFLMKAPVEDQSPPAIHVVMNWTQMLLKP